MVLPDIRNKRGREFLIAVRYLKPVNSLKHVKSFACWAGYLDLIQNVAS